MACEFQNVLFPRFMEPRRLPAVIGGLVGGPGDTARFQRQSVEQDGPMD